MVSFLSRRRLVFYESDDVFNLVVVVLCRRALLVCVLFWVEGE